MELNANVAQLIRIPIKTQQRRRNVQFAQRWILRSTTLSQPLNNDAIRMFPLLSFYLSGAKVMPAPVRLEVRAHSARSRHILSQSCRIQTCFARVLKQVKSVNGLLIAQFPIN